VERTSSANDAEKFATYYRDAKTGLDYAINRYYWSGLGRFLTADPYMASGGPSDPQSWNRYTYTRGDPVNRTDLTGLQDEGPDDIVDCGPYGLIPMEACRFFIRANGQPETSTESPSKQQELEERRKERVARNLYQGISAARKALANRDCFSFLSGGASIDPLAVLNGIFGGTLGSFAIADIPDSPGYRTSAVASVDSWKAVDIGNDATQLQVASVLIRVNDLAGDFVNGSLSDQSTTILHELGHAIYYLYGPDGIGLLSSSYGIQPDLNPKSQSETAKRSQANQDEVKKHCR
jgi:RHS repeat-associated protein